MIGGSRKSNPGAGGESRRGTVGLGGEEIEEEGKEQEEEEEEEDEEVDEWKNNYLSAVRIFMACT